MKCILAIGSFVFLGACLACVDAQAFEILSPTDTIIAFDTDPAGSNSSYPGGEAPGFVVDGNLGNKYLNYAGGGSGFIFTPDASYAIQSFQFTVGGDAETRDPASFELWGTDFALASIDNSTGVAEPWTLVSSGPLSNAELPSLRGATGDPYGFANATSYAHYKMIFPATKGSSLFQLAEASFYESNDGTGSAIAMSGDPVLAVHFAPDSRYPNGTNPESPQQAIDGNVDTKYLNFGKENSGFIVTPDVGSSIVKTFQITTANDHESRDPSSWILYGTNDAIQSDDNSRADGGEVWTVIDSGSVELPVDRKVAGPYVLVDNDTPYTSYRMEFPSVRDTNAAGADSIQYADIQFFSTSIPEPSSISLGLLLAVGFSGCVRKHKA